MLSWIKSLFSEDSSVSMMRVMSFICCLTACKLALDKGPDEISVIIALLGAAFGGKVSQKMLEVKDDDGK